jgi:hypothetical protein
MNRNGRTVTASAAVADLGEVQALSLQEDDPDRYPEDEHDQRLDGEESPDVPAVSAYR